MTADKLLKRFEVIEDRHWWWEGRRRLVADFLKSSRTDKPTILDVGCGTGETMSFIKRVSPGSLVWGIDKSRVAIRFASNRGHKTVKLANAIKLPFKGKTFNAVLALDVLEHIREPQRALIEMKRVLTDGGKILITSPALKFIWSRHDAGQGHITRFDKSELERMAEKTGLKIELVRYFNFFLSGPIILIRVISRLPGLGFVAGYDNGINYGVVNIRWLNNLLTRIFVAETGKIREIDYPWGVSVMAVMVKS